MQLENAFSVASCGGSQRYAGLNAENREALIWTGYGTNEFDLLSKL